MYKYTGGSYVGKDSDGNPVSLTRGQDVSEKQYANLPEIVQRRCTPNKVSEAATTLEDVREQVAELQETVSKQEQTLQEMQQEKTDLQAEVKSLQKENENLKNLINGDNGESESDKKEKSGGGKSGKKKKK